MSAITRGGEQSARDGQRTAAPKWRYVYFLLAAFDLVTVSGGLYLNYRIMGIYLRSVEVNRVWAERAAAYSHLGALAADVDAPGNDVFDTHDVQRESARMGSATRAFDLDLVNERYELRQHLDADAAAPLLARLDAIAVAKTQMTEEASRIFDFFLHDRADLAGQRMATMDQKYASLNQALLELRGAVSAIQQENFAAQTSAAAELQRYEYAIALAIVVMVVGATFYGQKIAQQMQSDAEERERHFNALRAAELRTRSILDTAAEGIVTFDELGRIEGFNHAAERLFGEEPGQSIGRDIRTLIPAMAGCLDAKAAEPFGESAAAGRLEVAGGEHVGLRRDGTQFPLEFSVSRVHLGPTRTFTAIVRDISDRRRTEEVLRFAAAEHAANRAKSQFLANMSHEIRTPMSGVLGMAELLLDTNLAPAQRRFAEGVHRSGESLLKIIDDILDFSKIEAGKMALEHVEFHPRGLVDEVAQLLRDGAGRKGLALVCRVESDVPDTLLGAPSRLRQVLINLVGNAIKFTDRGRVAMVVSTLHSDADRGAAPGGAGPPDPARTLLRFAVEDTGVGIAESVQQRVFYAFEQADSSTTRSHGGTGLGLAISRELVERMGGQIGVRSVLGQGSEFWFTVPLDRPLTSGVADARDATEATEASRLKGIRVLLAEDNPINQDVALAMLQSLGCQVHVVDTGTKALEALNTSEFDIVLMDRQMPELDGFDTTAEIRARGLLRPKQPRERAAEVRLPVVGLTASALKGDREICLAAGMDDYLAKPFRRDSLRAVLERWVLDRSVRHPDGDVSDAATRDTFDRTVLDRMCPNQPAAPRILAGLIDRYFDDALKLIGALESARDRADAGALAHAAHLLGVGSELVGARRLAALCGDLERAARAAEPGDLKPRVDAISREYETVHLAMQAVRPGG